MTAEKLQQLVKELDAKVSQAYPRPKIVPPAPSPGVVLDSITREAMYSRIRDLQRMYQLGWLLRQETFHVPAMECLEDAELSGLLTDMERARECLVEGVCFEDAGLVRSRALDL